MVEYSSVTIPYIMLPKVWVAFLLRKSNPRARPLVPPLHSTRYARRTPASCLDSTPVTPVRTTLSTPEEPDFYFDCCGAAAGDAAKMESESGLRVARIR
jgi:hypothetical protein